MIVAIVASKQYSDLGFIRHMLSATHEGELKIDTLFAPDNDSNGNKVAKKWAEDLGIPFKHMYSYNGSYEQNLNAVDIVIVFAAGTQQANNAAVDTIKLGKQLHVFQDPLDPVQRC